METTQQSSTKQDILKYLLKELQATALQLAKALNVSPQAIRRHLKDLEAEELIIYSSEQIGMGRPQHVYKLNNKGKERLSRENGDSYGQFAVSLLDTLAETVGPDQVSTILEKQWKRKAEAYRQRVGAGLLRQRVANLVEIRKAEGFMAEYHPVETSDSEVED